MATKLFLRNTTQNGITGSGVTYYDMLTTAGAASDTGVVDTAASGTEIQWTKDTTGDVEIQWLSGRAPSGGFTLTTTDISIWARESNMNANCGGRFRVFKRASGGTETEVGGGPFNDGVEFTTSDAEYTWAGNVTDTSFAENDRILLKVYITNVGTMATGHTCTLTFNAADAATGDSFFNIAETITFKPEDQSITGAGNIGTAEAFGTASVILSIAPSGIATQEAFGTAKLNFTLAPSGIATGEAFGSDKVNFTLAPSGIGTAEAFGTTTVSTSGGAQTISGAGNIASAEAFGTGKITLFVTPSGITTGEAFGSIQQLSRTLPVTGIASTESFGSTKVVLYLVPSGIATAEAFGTIQQLARTLPVSGIASAEAFGTSKINRFISPGGIGSAEAFGAAKLNFILSPSGIATGQAFGTIQQLARTLIAGSIATGQAFGTLSVGSAAAQTISGAGGIVSGEGFGTATIRHHQTLTLDFGYLQTLTVDFYFTETLTVDFYE